MRIVNDVCSFSLDFFSSSSLFSLAFSLACCLCNFWTYGLCFAPPNFMEPPKEEEEDDEEARRLTEENSFIAVSILNSPFCVGLKNPFCCDRFVPIDVSSSSSSLLFSCRRYSLPSLDLLLPPNQTTPLHRLFFCLFMFLSLWTEEGVPRGEGYAKAKRTQSFSFSLFSFSISYFPPLFFPLHRGRKTKPTN